MDRNKNKQNRINPPKTRSVFLTSMPLEYPAAFAARTLYMAIKIYLIISVIYTNLWYQSHPSTFSANRNVDLSAFSTVL